MRAREREKERERVYFRNHLFFYILFSFLRVLQIETALRRSDPRSLQIIAD